MAFVVQHLLSITCIPFQVIDQLQGKETECKDMQSELEDQQRRFGVLRHQLGVLYEDFNKEKQHWKDAEQDLRKALATSNENLDGKL